MSFPASDFESLLDSLAHDIVNGSHRFNSLSRNGKLDGQMKMNGDTDRYQFRPETIAMGSLSGKHFTQVFGAICERGETSDDGRKMARSFLAFNFKKEQLIIKAGLQVERSLLPPALLPLDAELSFDDITSQGIHVFDQPSYIPGRRLVTVTISCRRPPKFYVEFEESDENARWIPKRRRATAMDFARTGVRERDAGPISVIPDGPCSYPTFWNTYKWTFQLSEIDSRRFQACANKIRLLAQTDPERDLLSTRSAGWEMDLARSNRIMEDKPADLSNVQFSTRALIEGLVAFGILQPNAISTLIEALKRHAVVPFFRDRILESLFSEERIRNVEAVVKGKAGYLRRTESVVLPHLVMIRTVQVTPTRVLVGPLQQEPSNSVTRKYKDRLDAIIRVVFTDEEDHLRVDTYTKTADRLKGDVGVMARVRRALQHGLFIGGQQFHPVASSSSQQKDHAMWFVNTAVIDLIDLKKWMGEVEETIVAKHAARMGLPFSSTRGVDFEIEIGPELRDVERNGHCFTDGCGVAGREVMRQSATALGVTLGINSNPSAIQFRLGGAKGVLSYWPGMTTDHGIRLRKSQTKFQSNLKDLNVVRLAKYQVAFLNRQFIMIMCANGVPEKLILKLFKASVENIRGLADRVREGRHTPEDCALLSQCSDFPLQTLIKNGFNKDPLVLDITKIIECRTLQDLKWRARLKLPTGVFMIGIADESGLLNPGEVFCQFQESEAHQPTIVRSEVVVCRAPALHPGDVRRAFAVDVPQLRHLVNVIVFSVQGERDLPNMLGGGDLDGDDYTLIWDEEFVQTLTVYQPMNYTAPPPVRVDRVTQADLNENFVQYILNDVLGQVDNCHLSLADRFTPFDDRCMKLSEIHSTAVDFAKTGIAADLTKDLRPTEWPDFMDKDEDKTYDSEQILGQLFRAVHPEPHFDDCDLKSMGYPTDPRITRFKLHMGLLNRLKPIKAQYENAIQFEMRRYRVFEAEIPAGIALKNKKRKRARDQNLNEPLRDAYQIHILAARQAALAQMTQLHFSGTLTPAQIVARHCYALTYEREHVEQWRNEVESGLWGGYGDEDERNDLTPRAMTSFAWVFWQELVQLATADPEA